LKVQFAVIDSVRQCVVFPASLSSLNPSFETCLGVCLYVNINEAIERERKREREMERGRERKRERERKNNIAYVSIKL